MFNKGGDHRPRLGHVPDPSDHGAAEDQDGDHQQPERRCHRLGRRRPERLRRGRDRECGVRRHREAAEASSDDSRVHPGPTRLVARNDAYLVGRGPGSPPHQDFLPLRPTTGPRDERRRGEHGCARDAVGDPRGSDAVISVAGAAKRIGPSPNRRRSSSAGRGRAGPRGRRGSRARSGRATGSRSRCTR